MNMPREIVTLKSALDELLAAHDEFDAASFYGTMGELHVAQLKVDAARRRARLIRRALRSRHRPVFDFGKN